VAIVRESVLMCAWLGVDWLMNFWVKSATSSGAAFPFSGTHSQKSAVQVLCIVRLDS